MIQDTATLPSGSKLSMQVASWGIVGRLRWTLSAQLKAVHLDFSNGLVRSLLVAAATGDRDAILKAIAGEDLETFKNLVLQLAGSPELESAVFDCALCCTLNGVKITKDIFEDEDARSDYYPIVWEVLKLNLRPFFKSLVSTLPTPTSPKVEVQK
jgi:hypothetical protein